MARNPNPIVMWGSCITCGGKVALFEQDADDYLDRPLQGLEHFSCMLLRPADRERLRHELTGG